MSFIIETPNLTLTFIHIPKTGGMALINHLSKFFNVHRGGNKLWLGPLAGHFTYQETLKKVGESHYFCTVRNPWERMFSYYRFIKFQSPSFHGLPRLHKDLNNGMNFELFIKHVVSSTNPIFRPQFKYLIDYNMNVAVDSVLRLEKLDLMLGPFLANHNIKIKNTPVQRINQANSENYKLVSNLPVPNYHKHYLSEEMISSVANFEKDIIKIFKYKF